MQSRDSNPALLKRLAEGWTPTHCGLAQELARRLKDALGISGEVKTQVEENALTCSLDLSGIRLRGMEEVPCLLLGGAAPAPTIVRDFWKRANAPGRILCVLALSEGARAAAEQHLVKERCLLLDPEQVAALLEAEDARELFKRFLREQIALRQLIPYGILLPVQGNMFYGRQHDLARLREEADVSFAVAGPGRLGKTSLVLEYQRQLVRARDPRATRKFYINFFDCADTTADGIARFLAMRIEASQRSAKLDRDGLLQFLRRHVSLFGGPLDLLLDEVDLVCDGEGFRLLAKAARQGLCRLVLCGRGVLLKTVLSKQSPLEHRLELLRLRPLDAEAARRLILEPLADLGFTVTETQQLVERICKLTGRMPHLIQFYCKRLATVLIEEERHIVGPPQLDALRWDFETAQFFVSPLSDLTDPETRAVAQVLLKEGLRNFNAAQVRELAAQRGLELDVYRALEICNELVINNVLVWDEGHFRPANEALLFYAREMKLLDETASR
jgi:hypothetical protein